MMNTLPFRFVLLGSILSFSSLALADAETDYKTLFGAEEAKVAASRNSKDAADFAAKLLNAAKTLGEQKDLQALLCEKAYEFASRNPSGQQTGADALKLLIQAAPDKKAQVQERLVKSLQARFARSAGDERKRLGEELVELLVARGDERAEAKAPGEAVAAYRQALSIATSIGAEQTKEIMDKIKGISSAQESARKLTALKARLAKDSKDTTARTELILLYLGEFDNPGEAAKLVAPDLDERLRTYLPLAAKPVEELEEAVCLELAQWYVDLAEKASTAGKPILLGRGKECCERFMALHTAQDVTRLKGKMLLDKVAKGAADVAARASAGLPKMIALDLGKGVAMKLVLIPGGKFLMGSMQAEQFKAREEWRRILKSHDPDDSLSKLFANEGPQHEVTISKPFYMGVCEVTQEQYQAVMGTDPSKFKGAKNPVEDVTWTEAMEFCRTLSQKTGKTVRLPTEAQWEYACRAGTKTRFSFGDDDAGLYRHGNYADRTCAESDNVAGVDVNHSDGHARTSPAGSYKPNPWGLYDMHGNVWEWCADWDSESYRGAEARDPAGPDSGTKRVARGGSWICSPQYCRSAVRLPFPPDGRGSIGIRVVVEAGRGN